MIPRYVVITLSVLTILILVAFLFASFGPTWNLWMFGEAQSKIWSEEVDGQIVFKYCESVVQSGKIWR